MLKSHSLNLHFVVNFSDVVNALEAKGFENVTDYITHISYGDSQHTIVPKEILLEEFDHGGEEGLYEAAKGILSQTPEAAPAWVDMEN